MFDRRARGCYNNQAASKRQDKLRTGARLQSETTKKVGAIHYAGYYRYRGKQYNVKEGDVIFVEKLGVEADETVTFDQVLAVVDGANSTFGAPTVAGAKVEAKVLKNGKGKKIRVFKYRSKKDSKSLKGHRQPYTKVQIEKIAL